MKPRLLGYRANGAPIYLIAGGRQTAAELRAELATLRTEAGTLAEAMRDGTATDEQIDRANEIAERITALQGEITTVEAEEGGTEDERAARAAAARDALANLPEDPAPRSPRGGTGQRAQGAATRMAERPAMAVAARSFVESDAVAQFRERGNAGTASFDVRGLTPSDLAFNARAVLDSTGVPTRNPYVGLIEPQLRPLQVVDLVDRQTTGMNSVPYVQETSDPTAGAAETADGSLKPEATFTFAEAEAPVRTIPAFMNIVRQSAEDNPTLRGLIEGRLGYKVLYRLDSQVLNGNGTAPNIRGILATSGINTVAPGAAEARIISIRKAITEVQVDEFSADGVVLNPRDWELVELSADSNGQFRVSSNVQDALTPRIWGVRVVVTNGVTFATGVVGAWRLGATLWEREGVRLLMTDSHASNFTSNILTILAELRAALTVWRPSAFCKITFNGTN